LTLDDNYNNPIKDERQNASKKGLNYAMLGEISPHVCKLMETYSIVFPPDQLESVNTILISYSERIWSVKESLHAIGEIFKKLLTDEKHVNIKDEFMNALVNDYDFHHFDPISLALIRALSTKRARSKRSNRSDRINHAKILGLRRIYLTRAGAWHTATASLRIASSFLSSCTSRRCDGDGSRCETRAG